MFRTLHTDHPRGHNNVTTRIGSLQNPRIKRVVKLRQRRQRDRQRRTLIDGVREIGRALESDVQIEQLFYCPEMLAEGAEPLLTQAAKRGAQTIEVTAPVFEKIAYGERAEGMLAVAVTCERGLDRFSVPRHRGVAVVEGIEKPGNLGAILRSADAAGMGGVIVADGRTDLFNPNVIRASLGTVFTLPVATAESAEALAWLRHQQRPVFAARVDARTLYTDVDLRPPAAIVLGSEAQGLGPLWQAADVTGIRLPMCGVADSLNVSATAAVLFYESLRQRGITTQP